MNSDLQGLTITAVLAAPMAWLVTMGGRAAMAKWLAPCPGSDPGLWTWALRVLATVAGGVAGWMMTGWPLGYFAGCLGGLLCTTIVAGVKARARKMLLEAVLKNEQDSDEDAA